MTLEVHNWSSSAHKEVHRIISHEIAPIINQVDARVQNFEIQFLQEAAKFVRDFKSLAKEADKSLDKQKSLELEIKRLLKASVSHDIISIVQNSPVDVPSDLRTELDHTKEKLELYIIKKEKEYALRDLKGKNSDTPSASNTIDPLNQKLESKIVELEFQVANYERKISHLKTTYMNLFDSIKSNRAHAKLHDLIFENAKLRARLFKNTFEFVKNTSGTSVTPHVDKLKLSALTPHSNKLHASTQSHYVPQPSEFNVVRHKNVIAPGMFKINPSQMPRVDLVPNKQSSARIRTNSITNSQRHVIVKENVSSNMATASSIGLVHTTRTRRPQPKGNTRNAKVLSASKSSKVKKIVTVEDHHRTLLLSKNWKTMSSECNNIKLAIQNDKSKIVCDTWSKERLASKPRLHRLSLKWSPYGSSFDQKGKLVASKGTNCPNDDKACTSNPQEPMRKRFPNSTVFLGRLSKFVCGGTLASSEIRIVLTCSKAIMTTLDILRFIFFKTKDETPEVIKNFLKKIFVRLQAPVIIVRTNNGTEFKNQVLKEYFNSVGITHENSAAKTPQQNGIVERRNRMLVEAARTMLIFSHAPLFLWDEAIATAKPDISYLYVFGALCYSKNDREDIGKLGAKGDIGFFIRYSANSVAYRVYNRRTRKIMDTMNVMFDELSEMAFEQNSLRPELQ
nr:hypothetical protein [Tanacetum cinerariifolium]